MGFDENRVETLSPVLRFVKFLISKVDQHITWFRETVVEPNRKEYYWYHQKIRRVPTIDECYDDDFVCQYEANFQFQLDKKVEWNIVKILKRRHERCVLDYPYDWKEYCSNTYETWQQGLTNYFIKYGDLGNQEAFACYMKQKHRLAFERRHGPVGSGRKAMDELKPPKKDSC